MKLYPTQEIGLAVNAVLMHGEHGITCEQLERITGVPARRCQSILLTVSRVIPIYDDPEQTPVRWFVVPESQRC